MLDVNIKHVIQNNEYKKCKHNNILDMRFAERRGPPRKLAPWRLSVWKYLVEKSANKQIACCIHAIANHNDRKKDRSFL